ncbi:MAG TPA: hypothetical protein RMH99_15915 [Sandaracinaceae bacterium LLY-WYZ-13_1]|nr:hypothetical protein [Sandaracinaceae bacterium LLY-WYZ-13_1]
MKFATYLLLGFLLALGCDPRGGLDRDGGVVMRVDADPDDGDVPPPACSCDGRTCGDDGCGNPCGECGTGLLCSAGACIAGECPEGSSECSGECVELDSDPRHCGSCGLACPDDPNGAPVCVAAGCGLECEPGYRECGGSCVACPEDGVATACDGSRCVATECGAGALACGGECAACPPGAADVSCNGRGECVAGACAAGRKSAEGECVCHEEDAGSAVGEDAFLAYVSRDARSDVGLGVCPNQADRRVGDEWVLWTAPEAGRFGFSIEPTLDDEYDIGILPGACDGSDRLAVCADRHATWSFSAGERARVVVRMDEPESSGAAVNVIGPLQPPPPTTDWEDDHEHRSLDSARHTTAWTTYRVDVSGERRVGGHVVVRLYSPSPELQGFRLGDPPVPSVYMTLEAPGGRRGFVEGTHSGEGSPIEFDFGDTFLLEPVDGRWTVVRLEVARPSDAELHWGVTRLTFDGYGL